MKRTLMSSLVAGLLALVAATRDAQAVPPPGICQDVYLLNAVRIIDAACTPEFCDPAKLKELENVPRSDLLRALRDPGLMPVHIFFPSGKRKLNEAYDWETIKEDQLKTISYLNNPNDTTIFIIGYASKTGDEATNVNLSRDRMYAVYFYLKNTLKVKCKLIKGAWVGKTVLQLHESDAQILNLVARDYRNDPLILNQSVHVFIYPCGL